jgi:hypothetical protein
MKMASDEQKARLRAQAARLRSFTFATIEPGQLWTIDSTIHDRDGRVVEHSWSPVAVVILQQLDDQLVEVAPLSYDIDLAGPGDVAGEGTVFERPFMVETWLRLPIGRSALARGIGRLSPAKLQEIVGVATEAVGATDPPFGPDDPRAAYREDEHLRVLFVAAGAGSGGLVFEEALSAKLNPTRWHLEPQRTEPSEPTAAGRLVRA